MLRLNSFQQNVDKPFCSLLKSLRLIAIPNVAMTDFSASEFTRYAAVHENTKGAGDARPTALQIVKDDDLEGRAKSGRNLLCLS